MWLSRSKLNRSFVALALVLGAMNVSACSFMPLYGNRDAVEAPIPQTVTRPVPVSTVMSYTKPHSRIEQIIYQDLTFKLGRTENTEAKLVSVIASQSTRRVGRTSSGSPATTYELTVIASLSVIGGTDGTESLFSTTRRATATYTTNGQTLADRQAVEDASERAAIAVAQILRLAMSAALFNK